MREPPETTTVNEPFCWANFSDKWAVYLARETERDSSESNTWTVFSVAMLGEVEAFVLKQLTFLVGTIREMLVWTERMVYGDQDDEDREENGIKEVRVGVRRGA